MGKGSFNEQHPQFCGVYGGAGSLPDVISAVEESDCILWIGNFPVRSIPPIGRIYTLMCIASERLQYVSCTIPTDFHTAHTSHKVEDSRRMYQSRISSNSRDFLSRYIYDALTMSGRAESYRSNKKNIMEISMRFVDNIWLVKHILKILL